MTNLTVTLIQPDLVWEDPAANRAALEKRILAIPEKTEVVILPEMFATGFSMRPEMFAEPMNGPSFAWMRRVAAEKKCILTGSLMIRGEGGAGPGYYNRLIWMLPDGNFGTYDKRHLFGYAREDAHYAPGEKKLIASVKGWKINLKICYDLRFPVWLRQNIAGETGGDPAPEYDVLIVVANWPATRIHAWKTLLQARAIENQCFVIGVNRIGIDGNGFEHIGHSLIAGPSGEVLELMDNPDQQVITYTLNRSLLEDTRARFPFWRDADRFLIQP